MQSTCQQQQAQPGQNGTSASRTSFLIEDILSRGTVTPHTHHHQLHHQHLTHPTSGHTQQHHQYQFASLLPGYPAAPPAAAAFFLGPLFGSAGMGVGVVPGVGELAALKHCRRRKARTVSTPSMRASHLYPEMRIDSRAYEQRFAFASCKRYVNFLQIESLTRIQSDNH